jgi:GNAT superfamily N-acetyltransferase
MPDDPHRRQPSVDVAPEPVEGIDAQMLLAEFMIELRGRWRGPISAADEPEEPGDGLSPPDGSFHIARIDGRPVGCVGLRTVNTETGELKRMYVRPESRGVGIARALLQAVEAEALGRGFRVVRLDTMAELVEAQQLYRTSGYREIPPYNDNPYTRHWYQKLIRTRPASI